VLIAKIKNGQIVKLNMTKEIKKQTNRFILEKLTLLEKEHPALVVVSNIQRGERILYVVADRKGNVIMNGAGEQFKNAPFVIPEEKLMPFNIPTEMVSLGGEVINTNIPPIIIEKCLQKASLSRQVEVMVDYAKKHGFIFEVLEMDPYKKMLHDPFTKEVVTTIKGTLQDSTREQKTDNLAP